MLGTGLLLCLSSAVILVYTNMFFKGEIGKIIYWLLIFVFMVGFFILLVAVIKGWASFFRQKIHQQSIKPWENNRE
jgi:K+-transporting ATPase A subunit